MSEAETLPVKKFRKGCKIGCGFLGAVFLGIVMFYGPAAYDFFRVFGCDSLRKPEKHAYSATSEQNLKAIYQGLMLHHESEGQFPNKETWMDEIENRLKSNDLAKGEAEKKLVRPDLVVETGRFGYAISESAAGKYKEDIEDQSTTPLIYESKQTERNAHGNPSQDRNGLAIAVDGTILKD